jgi:hypothetical protein
MLMPRVMPQWIWNIWMFPHFFADRLTDGIRSRLPEKVAELNYAKKRVKIFQKKS